MAGSDSGDAPTQRVGLTLRERIVALVHEDQDGFSSSLPTCLRPASRSRVTALDARRLAMGKMFGGGARSACVGTAGSGAGHVPAIYVGARQTVMVKVFEGRQGGAGGIRSAGQAVSQHLRYLVREGLGADGNEAGFYGPEGTLKRGRMHCACTAWDDDRHHFRLIFSPEHVVKIECMASYVRAVMASVATDLREPKMTWVAINHHDTDQPHTHVLIHGKRANGRDLVIPRKVISGGIRGRAMDCAQDLLDDQSRFEAERGLYARTTADRWTDIDRKLELLAAAHDGVIPRSEIESHDTFGAVTRGRIAHLARLNLVATDTPEGVRLGDGLKDKLDRLQLAQDQIRSQWAAEHRAAMTSQSGANTDRVQPNLAEQVEPTVPVAAIVMTPTSMDRPNPVKAFDPKFNRLTPLDVELMRRGQLSTSATHRTHMGADIKVALSARAARLVTTDQAFAQCQGLG